MRSRSDVCDQVSWAARAASKAASTSSMLDLGMSATGSPVSGETVVRVSPVVLRMRPVSSATRAGDTASRAVRSAVGVDMTDRIPLV